MKERKWKEREYFIAPFIYYVYLKALRHGSHSFTCKYNMTAFPSRGELYAPPRVTHSPGERMAGDSTHLLRPLDGRFHVPPNGTQLWTAIARPLETFSGGSFSYFSRLVRLCYFMPKTRNLTRGFWEFWGQSFFVCVHQMAPPLTEVGDIQLQLTTYLSTPKGWKAELAWLVNL